VTINQGAPAWEPQAGIGGLLLAFGLLLAMVSRGILTKEIAHHLLDEQMALLEDLRERSGYSEAGNAQISAALRDLLWLRHSLQSFPATSLPP